MSSTYNPTLPPPSFVTPLALTCPADGDSRTAAAQNAPDQKMADLVEQLRRAQLGVRSMFGQFSAPVDTTNKVAYGGDYRITYTGATAPVLSTPLASYNGPMVTLATPLNTNYTAITAGDVAGLFAYQTWLYAVYEAEVSLSAVGGNSLTVTAGISNTTDVTGNFKGALFYKKTSDTNWQCSVNDGATTSTTNSGTAPSAGTVQCLRIEMYGSGVSGGLRCLFYIDGVLKATKSTNNYTGASFLSSNLGMLASGNTANTVAVGRIATAWTLKNGY